MVRRPGGFTYLGVLLAIALLGVSLSITAEVWTTTAHRQKLVEVEFVGQQYVLAIASYYDSSWGGPKVLPKDISDLLEDRRGPVIRRHLRRIYLNPFTGSQAWRPINASQGGIEGVEIAIPSRGGEQEVRRFLFRPSATQ